MENLLNELKARLREVKDLEAATAVLYWDQSTYMPPGGSPARAQQLATLSKLQHERFTDPEIGRLLEKLRPHAETLPYESDDAALIRLVSREYERAIKIPPQFIATLNQHSALTYQIWTEARAANNFAAVQDNLERTLELSREMANFFPGYEHIADPLIEAADYGMKASAISKLFAELREQLVPLVKAITEQEPADDSCLHQHFPEQLQREFGEEVIQRFGYDFSRGRQDKTYHPFMIGFSIDDVRITTRFKENHLAEALFSTMHESGHAMYEQGIDKQLEGTLLATGTSAGVHESQSRLWENVVGRSIGFWRCFYPRLQQVFPEQLRNVPLETFYRAINKVERSLIRTDADEVTYNLHVMLRFDFELALLEGRLQVRDLPEAWRARYQEDLGIAPPDDRDGVMQDVHWFSGVIGGVFQGYTLGNILSAQFYDAALRAHPEIPSEIEQGVFSTLHGWLRDNIYRHGRKFTPAELVERATGGPLSIEPYITYLRTKYEPLYGLK